MNPIAIQLQSNGCVFRSCGHVVFYFHCIVAVCECILSLQRSWIYSAGYLWHVIRRLLGPVTSLFSDPCMVDALG